ADPGRRLSELPLLSAAEQQALREWNDTAAGYLLEVGLHELVLEQARQTPEAVALEFEGAALSYGELETRAGEGAEHLRTLGVGPEVRVGIAMERSLELPVALLAVLGAGGCYVPLDPAYPAARLEFMLGDSGVTVLLTQERLRAKLPEQHPPIVILSA